MGPKTTGHRLQRGDLVGESLGHVAPWFAVHDDRTAGFVVPLVPLLRLKKELKARAILPDADSSRLIILPPKRSHQCTALRGRGKENQVVSQAAKPWKAGAKGGTERPAALNRPTQRVRGRVRSWQEKESTLDWSLTVLSQGQSRLRLMISVRGRHSLSKYLYCNDLRRERGTRRRNPFAAKVLR